MVGINFFERLRELADEGYREFNGRIVATGYPMLGVRMPAMKKLAAEIAALPDGELARYLDEGLGPIQGVAGGLTYEVVQLYGLVLMEAGRRRKIAPEEVFDRFEALVPFFDSWAHVDTVVTGPFFGRHRDEVFERFRRLKNTPGEFSRRTWVIIQMSYFMDSAHIGRTLEELRSVPQGQYYVDMALAWALSVALIKLWEVTLPLLETPVFSRFVHNKAIQKARESYRIAPERKAYLNTLKIK